MRDFYSKANVGFLLHLSNKFIYAMPTRVRLLLIVLMAIVLCSCFSNKRDRSARQRYHVKRDCGCTH